MMELFMPYRLALLFVFFVRFALPAAAATPEQKAPTVFIAGKIAAFKADPRGPFQGIRWFCPDGSVRPANSPCGVVGGRQHGLIRDEVAQWRLEHRVYLAQILVAADPDSFWDANNDNARVKQYLLEKYLQAIDDGWIMRKAQYYRGALQAEGEERWGEEFLAGLLSRDEVVERQFFFARQLVRNMPQQAKVGHTERIRLLAKNASDLAPSFVDLKNKIHSQPDAQDRQRVAQFRADYAGKITAGADSLLAELASEIELAYKEVDNERLLAYTSALPADSPIAASLRDALAPRLDLHSRYAALAETLWRIRQGLAGTASTQRLALMRLSLDLEEVLYRLDRQWQPTVLSELLEKNFVLARAAAGCGYLEEWEWRALEAGLTPPAMRRTLGLADFTSMVERTRRAVGWGTSMVESIYGVEVERFAAFEPMTRGFVDEQVRGSILLPWGDVAAQLADLATRYAGAPDYALGQTGTIRGQNPGYALGELEVVTGAAEDIAFSDKKIYILLRAPADLKPVAGIATASEGNAVSHVQLLARNLGIPNAVLSPSLLQALKPFSGQRVFYAVSPRGRVIIKKEAEMSDEEKALFAVKTRSEERIRVPVERLELDRLELLTLYDLRASASGRLCGPKAANLGQLSALFPGKVAPGLVIPFGVFRRHMELPMPGTNGSHWHFLQETFSQAKRARDSGVAETSVDSLVIGRLTQLRQALRQIQFADWFDKLLDERFAQVFGAPLGEVAVFVRSDTNMEDLKDFTGAGLNLTVPNERERDKIRQAIRDVWASPFSERSYRWRHKYLLNPENVYPSILLLKSVPAEKSGVMVTTGVSSGNPIDVTVAFSRGVGGAVDGQAAETYLLRQDGIDQLLAPARERRYTVLPPNGGIGKETAYFDQPLLVPAERLELRRLALEVRRRLPGTPGVESNGPFDIELGFVAGESHLFQVRPFVESKRAQSSLYLRDLDPPLRGDSWIPLNLELKK
jgi:hypothetical protein